MASCARPSLPGTTLKRGGPAVAAVLDERYAREPDGWRQRRLLAGKLAAKGPATWAEVAAVCGRARPPLFVWLQRVRAGGLEALLARAKPGPKESPR